MPLTPADVRNKQFSTTRLRPGYDEEEVDAFLDEIELALTRLEKENEGLRAKLDDRVQREVLPEFEPEPGQMVAQPTGEADLAAAERVLSLAQRTADQAVADAHREAGEVVAKARLQAEQITSDARARDESLEHDAHVRHRQAMSSLLSQREELERRVDDLRAFECEYRSRLKEYFEEHLRDLEDEGSPDRSAGIRAQ